MKICLSTEEVTLFSWLTQEAIKLIVIFSSTLLFNPSLQPWPSLSQHVDLTKSQLSSYTVCVCVCVCVYVCVCVCDIFQSFITVIHRLSSFFFFLFLIFSSFLSFLFFCIFYIISSLSFFSSHLPNFSSRLCSMAIDSPKPLQYCNDSKHYTYHFYSVHNCPLLRHYKKQRYWLINVNYFYISVVIHLFITW